MKTEKAAGALASRAHSQTFLWELAKRSVRSYLVVRALFESAGQNRALFIYIDCNFGAEFYQPPPSSSLKKIESLQAQAAGIIQIFHSHSCRSVCWHITDDGHSVWLEPAFCEHKLESRVPKSLQRKKIMAGANKQLCSSEHCRKRRVNWILPEFSAERGTWRGRGGMFIFFWCSDEISGVIHFQLSNRRCARHCQIWLYT